MPRGRLPECEIRVSARAKRPRFVVSVDQKVAVVIPRGFPKAEIPALVERHRAWIERTVASICAVKESVGENLYAEQQRSLPRTILFRCASEEWAVEYRDDGSPGVTVSEGIGEGIEEKEIGEKRIGEEEMGEEEMGEEEIGEEEIGVEVDLRGDPQRLLVSGSVADEVACRESLRAWLKRKAELRLLPRLRELSVVTGLAYKRAAVRSQQTRWASYSRKGTVSLNQKLLFLPERLVRHVLIHELCHSVHLNHSAEFWAALSIYAPDCKERASELKTAFKYVPRWVDMR